MANILVIDDEKSIRNTLQEVLEYESHKVDLATNGVEGLEFFEKGDYDIVLCDIKMPGINGVEAFKQIKKINPKMVSVMMTAYAVQHLIQEALDEGAYACISKPFDMEKIMETIKDISNKTA